MPEHHDQALTHDAISATINAVLAAPAAADWPAAVINLLTFAADCARPAIPAAADAPAQTNVYDALWAATERYAAAINDASQKVSRDHHDVGEGLAPRPLLVAAALQIACRLLVAQDTAVGYEWDVRRTRLNGLPRPATAGVTVLRRGPLVAQAVDCTVNHLGCVIEPGSPAALCRCGRSTIKPSCDTSCLRDGFDDAKDPNRVEDRRDTYTGQQVTVLDNRGICQHSGLCTDRLASVFHAGGDPFVTPSGGRMDEIIRAARDCPSGALSYAIDGHEARDQVDWHDQRPSTIEITADGPYRISGGITLTDEDGSPIERADGASREHAALCRCGHSQNKPFCSGMHWYVQFRDPQYRADHIQSIFEWAGGLPALTRMTRIFYERYVPADELLGPLFSTMSADHPQRVAAWLGEVFGGPTSYSHNFGGYTHMLSQHRSRGLTEQQRARWVELLTRSARDAGLPNDPEFRSAFGSYIEWGSRLAVENSQVTAEPPQHMPMPRWDWTTSAGSPGSRVSALAGAAVPTDAPVELPAHDEAVTFDPHIRSLFRARDRQSMLFAFDLWKHSDVAQHSAAILQRLQAGTMPCDSAWPSHQVEVFQRWHEAGAPA